MLGNCRDEVAIVEIDTWNGMKADVSRKIVMDGGCFLIVRLICAKIMPWNETTKYSDR